MSAPDKHGWMPIETAPDYNPAAVRPEDVLVYSSRIGVYRGSAGRMHGSVFAFVPTFGGDAVEHWGVTHWQPLPKPPVQS